MNSAMVSMQIRISTMPVNFNHAQYSFIALNSWMNSIQISFHDHEFISYISWPMNSDMNSCIVVIVYLEYCETISEIRVYQVQMMVTITVTVRDQR